MCMRKHWSFGKNLRQKLEALKTGDIWLLSIINQAVSLELRKAIVAETGSAEDRRYLANSYNNLGVILDDLGKLSEARNAYEKALELREALIAEAGNAEDRRDLATSYNNLGLGKANEAENLFTKLYKVVKKVLQMLR